MKFSSTFYNNFGIAKFFNEFQEIESVLTEIPLIVRPSKSKKTNRDVFDAVSTNSFIRSMLEDCNWFSNFPLDHSSKEFGKHVDFYKNGIILEVQFAHYGLGIRDLLRLDACYRGKIRLKKEQEVRAGVMVVPSKELITVESVINEQQLFSYMSILDIQMPLAIVAIKKE